MNIEEEFKIRFSTDELSNSKSIKDIIEILSSKGLYEN